MRHTKIAISTAVSQEDYAKLFALKEKKEKKAGVTLSFSQIASQCIHEGIIVLEAEDAP